MTRDASSSDRTRRRTARLSITIAITGTVLVIAYAAWALVQILVLNPRATVPGTPLDRIWDDVQRSQGGSDLIFVPAFLGFGVVLSLALLVISLVQGRQSPWTVAAWYLVLGAPAYFVASFGPGMSLADTYATGGADHSPWAAPLFLVSGAAVVASIALIVAASVRAYRASRLAA